MLRSCSGKGRYPHEKAARLTAEHEEQKSRERGGELRLRVYRCPSVSCGGWHLTDARDKRNDGY